MESTTAQLSQSGPEQVTESRLARRVAAASGALFTLGILIGDDTINGAGEPPTPMDPGNDSLNDVEQYLAKASDAVASGSYLVGRGIGVLALVALLVFSVHVAGQIRARERAQGMLSDVALGAGAVAAALGLVSATAQFAAVSRASKGIDPEVARALLDFSALTFVGMWLPIAVFMTAVAVAGRRQALVARWFTLATAIVALGLVAGLVVMPASNIGFFAIVLGFVWFLAASVVFVRRAT